MSQTASPPLLQWIEPLNDLARLRVLRVLGSSELGVGELASVLQLPQSTVSRHLKRLLEAGWIVRRTQGTAAMYQMASATLDDTARTLWQLASASLESMPCSAEDDHRAKEVIARRSVDSRRFFGDIGGEWTELRHRLFGQIIGLQPILGLLDPDWKVADLGCGTGQLAAELSTWVQRVEAIDREAAMLKAARKRLSGVDNVGLHKADVGDLPFEDDSMDASILSLILHHLDSPASALREAARITSGPILVIDMMSHERTDYRDTMGHLHLGFTSKELEALGDEVGLTMQRYVPLSPDPEATGPPLFVARLADR